MRKRMILKDVSATRDLVAETQNLIDSIRADMVRLDPVIDIGRSVISAYLSDPHPWSENMPIDIVAKIRAYIEMEGRR